MADSENKVLSALTVKLTNDENGNSSSAVRLTPGHLLYTNTDSVTGVDIGEVGKLKGDWSAVQGTFKVTEAIEDDDAVPLYQAEAITKHMIDHMVLQDLESTENKLVSDHPIHLQSDQSVLTLDTNGVYLGTADGKGLKIYEENGVGNVQLTAGTNLVKEVDGKIVDYATVADIEASKYALLQRNNVWTSANTFEDGLYVKYSEFDRPIKDEEAINLGYLNKVVAERFDKWTGPVSEISEKLDSEIEARKEADKELAANVTEQMSGIKAAVTKLSEDNVRQDVAVSEVSESLGNLEGTVSDITGILTQHAHEITVLQEKDADLSEAIIKEGKIRSENDIKLIDELGVEIQNRSENDVKISEFANTISEFANKISETLAEDYYDKSLLYTKSEADYLHQSEYLARVETEAHLSEQIVKSSTLGHVFQNSAAEESWDGSVRLLQGGSYSDGKVSFQSYSVDRIEFSILDTVSDRLASMSVDNDGVYILGNADIVSNLAVRDETKTDTLVVNTDASVGRDVTVHRHLVVEGNTNLHNSLNVGEDANVAGSVLTNAVNTKIANVSDRLLVGGTTKFIGDVLANSDIRVDGSFNAMAGAEMYPNLSGTALKTNGGTAHFDSVISFKGTEIELHGSLASEIESITNRVDALESPHFVIVEEIPNPEEAEFNVVYLVPHPHEGAEDNHDEYIKVLKDGVYVMEKIGHTDINLRNYYTKDDVYNKGEINAKFTEELSNYVDKDMLATKTTELSEKIVDGYYDKPQVDALVGARVAKVTGGPGIIVETEALNHANYEISMHLGRTVRPVETGDASPLARDRNDVGPDGQGALVIPRTDLTISGGHFSRDELKNGDFYQNTGRFWGSVKVVSNMQELLRCYNSSALDNDTSPFQTPRVYSFVPNVICIKDMLENLTGGGTGGSGSQLIGDATTSSKGIVQLASSIDDDETYRVVNTALLKDSVSDFVSYLANDSTSTTGSKHGNVILASTNGGEGGFYCGYTNSTSPSSTNHITKFTYDRLTFIGANASNVEEYVLGSVNGGDAGDNQIARIKDIKHPNDGVLTVLDAEGNLVGTFSADQATDATMTLPSFVPSTILTEVTYEEFLAIQEKPEGTYYVVTDTPFKYITDEEAGVIIEEKVELANQGQITLIEGLSGKIDAVNTKITEIETENSEQAYTLSEHSEVLDHHKTILSEMEDDVNMLVNAVTVGATTDTMGVVQIATTVNDENVPHVVNAKLLKDTLSEYAKYYANNSPSSGDLGIHGKSLFASQNGDNGGLYVGGNNNGNVSWTQWVTRYQRDRIRVYGNTNGTYEDFYLDPGTDEDKKHLQIARLKDIESGSVYMYDYLKKTETVMGSWAISSENIDSSILIGNSRAPVDVPANFSVVIGHSIGSEVYDPGVLSEIVAIGWGSVATKGSVSVGYSAAAYENSVAVGRDAIAQNFLSTALGDGAIATGQRSVQLGSGLNPTDGTLQFRGYPLVLANGKIPNERLDFEPSTFITVSGATTIIKEEVKNEIESSGVSPVYNSLVKITDATGVTDIGSFTTNAEGEQTVSLPFINSMGIPNEYDGYFSSVYADRLQVSHISGMDHDHILTVKSKSLSMEVSEISTGTPNATIHITEVIDNNEQHGLMNVAASVITVSSRSSEFTITNSADNHGITLNATGVKGEINLNAVGGVFVNGVEIGKEVPAIGKEVPAYPFTASIEWEETASTISEGYILHKPILVVNGGRFTQVDHSERTILEGRCVPGFSEFMISSPTMVNVGHTLYEMASFIHPLEKKATELYGCMLVDKVNLGWAGKDPKFVITGDEEFSTNSITMFKVVITTDKLVTEIDGVEETEVDCKLRVLDNYCPALTSTVEHVLNHTYDTVDEKTINYIVVPSQYRIPAGAIEIPLNIIYKTTELVWEIEVS